MPFLVTAILCLFYVLALAVDHSANVLFGLLLLSGIVRITTSGRPGAAVFWRSARQYWPIHLAMAAPLLAVLAHLLLTRHFSWNGMDFPSRLAVFPMIFWAVQLAPLRSMRRMQWVFVLGAAAGAVRMYVLTGGGLTRDFTNFIPLNIFAEMVLLTGIFAAGSLAWQNGAGRAGALLKLAALGAVLYAIYLSGTRGAWLTVPALIAMACAVFLANGVRLKHLAACAAVFVACAALAWQSGGIVKGRIAMAGSDIEQYAQGLNVDTSLGIRLQLWRSSWIMFREHPLSGVGGPGFIPALKELADRKVISPMAATYTHSHNDILFMMAKYGVLGLIAILALYLVPATRFGRSLSHPDKEIRSCACMGMALIVGLTVLGLSDVAFTCWEVAPFYVVSVAFLLAYIEKRQQQGQAIDR